MPLSKLLVVVAAGFGVASAFAQAALGTVVEVNGLVTATQGASGMTVTPGAAIQNGMRFITTTSGSVTLRLNSGCTVTVPAGHGVTVLQTMTCQQLTAAVQPIAPVVAGPATFTPVFPPAPLLVQGLVVAGAVGIGFAGFTQVIDNPDEPLSAR